MVNRYLVVTDEGAVMMFYIKACALLYAGKNEVKELIYDEDNRNYVERR